MIQDMCLIKYDLDHKTELGLAPTSMKSAGGGGIGCRKNEK